MMTFETLELRVGEQTGQATHLERHPEHSGALNCRPTVFSFMRSFTVRNSVRLPGTVTRLDCES